MKTILLAVLTSTFVACVDTGVSPVLSELPPPAGELVWVGQSFVGGQQCGLEPYSPPDTKQLLNSRGIAVSETKVEFHPVCLACMCPAYAATHYALISKDQVEEAATIGFRQMSPPPGAV